MVDPDVEPLFGLFAVGGLVYVGEGFFEPPGDSDFGVECEQLVYPGLFDWGELVLAAHEQPSASPHFRVEARVVLAGEASVSSRHCFSSSVADPNLLSC